MKKITKLSLNKVLLFTLLNFFITGLMAQRQVLQEWNFTNNSLASELYNTDFGIPSVTAGNNNDETGGAKDNTYTINGASAGATTSFFQTSINSGKLTVSMTLASWSFNNSDANNAYWGISMMDGEGTQITYFRVITQIKEGYIGTMLFTSFINPDDASFNNGGVLKAGALARGQASTDYTESTLPVTVNLTIDFDNDSYVIWVGDTNPGDDDGSKWGARFAQYTGTISFNRTISQMRWQWSANKNGGGLQDFIELDRVLIYRGEDATASVKDLKQFNFNFYPNPTKNEVKLSANDEIKSVEVYNLLGQSVINKKLNMKEPKIDVSDLSKGVYIMKVTIGESLGSYKFVKE